MTENHFLTWLLVFNYFLFFCLSQVPGLVLEELSLHGCKELTDYSVEALVKHQPSLRRLDISACTELTSRSVEAVAHGLKSLTHLSLSRDWRITEKGASGLYTQRIIHNSNCEDLLHPLNLNYGCMNIFRPLTHFSSVQV